MRFVHLVIVVSLILAIVVIYFYKSTSKRKLVCFSNPVPSWCVGVRNVNENNAFIRYTEEGEYGGKCTRTGYLYSIELEENNTFHITTADLKTGNFRTEFYLSINLDNVYVNLPKNVRNNNEQIFVCYDKNTIRKITNQLKESCQISDNDIFSIRKNLTKCTQDKISVNMSEEILIILRTNNKKNNSNQLVPFLYIKVENSTFFKNLFKLTTTQFQAL